MNWPGMGDPYKRKKTLKFLAITAIIAISVGLGSTLVIGQLDLNNPLKSCIDNRETLYKIKATLEIIIDDLPTPIPANINAGLDGKCQRAMYTLTDDGTIYAEWEEEYPWEIGHFLWMWEFPLRDMDQGKSTIFVNGEESLSLIHI